MIPHIRPWMMGRGQAISDQSSSIEIENQNMQSTEPILDVLNLQTPCFCHGTQSIIHSGNSTSLSNFVERIDLEGAHLFGQHSMVDIHGVYGQCCCV